VQHRLLVREKGQQRAARAEVPQRHLAVAVAGHYTGHCGVAQARRGGVCGQPGGRQVTELDAGDVGTMAAEDEERRRGRRGSGAGGGELERAKHCSRPAEKDTFDVVK